MMAKVDERGRELPSNSNDSEREEGGVRGEEWGTIGGG